MNITISPEALQWFKKDMEATPNDMVRFFARYGGDSKLHEGFSIGVTIEQPDEAVIQTVEDDITFYIEARDLWYFKDYDLHVDVSGSEIVYSHETIS